MEVLVLTDSQIEEGKKRAKYSLESGGHHEHNDCIRIAYEWLDAQTKIKGISRKPVTLKHLIENWAGRYVSTSDVDVAATLHPEIKGAYPFFNISSRLTRPSKKRLEGIGEAFTHHYKEQRSGDGYAKDE